RRTPVALPAIEIRLSDTGLGVTPYGVQISVAQVERAVALATLQAVLAEGVPAPRQGHYPADRAVELELVPKASAPGSGAAPAPAGAAGASSAAPRPSTAELAPISAPWMAEALNRIASDRALVDAIRGSVSADAADTANAAARAAEAANVANSLGVAV